MLWLEEEAPTYERELLNTVVVAGIDGVVPR